jgi:arylsulfatase A
MIRIALIIIMVAGFLSCQQANTQTKLPNIVLIFVDDLGYGDVSCLNPEAKLSTPAIDRLAKEGIVFTEAHASGSVCTPSRYGLLTGRYAFRAEYQQGPRGFLAPVIEPGRETLATILKNNGYTTACIGKWHLGLDWQTTDGANGVSINPETRRSNADFTKPVGSGPNSYGFNYSFIHPASTDMTPYMFIKNHQVIDTNIIMTDDIYPNHLEDTKFDWDYAKLGEEDVYWGRGIWWRKGEISESFRVEECLPAILDEGLNFIEKQAIDDSSDPFFLYLPLTGPHTPWLPSKPFKGKSPMEYYGDFVRDIDLVVERVTQKLAELEIAGETMIIFTSDNGAPWPEQDIKRYQHNANYSRRGQKGDVWDGGHHVPLIIRYPDRVKGGKIYDHLISLTDLFATIADLTGCELSNNSGEDSFSFMDVLNGHTEKVVRDHMVHNSSRDLYALRKDGWKFIDGLGSGGFTKPGRIRPKANDPKGQLYDITTDSLESNNLYETKQDIVTKMDSELKKIIDQGHSH